MQTRQTQLFNAVREKNQVRIKQLLTEDCDEKIHVNGKNPEGHTFLHFAIDTMDVATVKTFCKYVTALDLELPKHTFPPVTHFVNLVRAEELTQTKQQILILLLGKGCTFNYFDQTNQNVFYVKLNETHSSTNKLIYCEALLRGNDHFITTNLVNTTIASTDLEQYLKSYKELFGKRRRITTQTAQQIQTFLQQNNTEMPDKKIQNIYRILLNPDYVVCNWNEVLTTDNNRTVACKKITKVSKRKSERTLDDMTARLQYHLGQLDAPYTINTYGFDNACQRRQNENEAAFIMRKLQGVTKYNPKILLNYLQSKEVFHHMLFGEAVHKIIEEISKLANNVHHDAYSQLAQNLLRMEQALSPAEKTVIATSKIVIGVIEETAEEIKSSLKGKEEEVASNDNDKIAELTQRIESMEIYMASKINELKSLIEKQAKPTTSSGLKPIRFIDTSTFRNSR